MDVDEAAAAKAVSSTHRKSLSLLLLSMTSLCVWQIHLLQATENSGVDVPGTREF